jgi:NADH/NAD ratio-sensing transcriptional regulator Rex
MSLGRKLARSQQKKDKMSKTGMNEFLEATTNLIVIGKCSCGKPLYHYIKSEKNNLFNMYCLDSEQGCPVRDARKEYPGVEIYTTPQLRSAVDIIVFAQSLHAKKDWTEDELASIPMRED